jgi:hypothetical protein
MWKQATSKVTNKKPDHVNGHRESELVGNCVICRKQVFNGWYGASQGPNGENIGTCQAECEKLYSAQKRELLKPPHERAASI